MLPHQGIVALGISLLTLVITLTLLTAILLKERQQQAQNERDDH